MKSSCLLVTLLNDLCVLLYSIYVFRLVLWSASNTVRITVCGGQIKASWHSFRVDAKQIRPGMGTPGRSYT